MTGIQRHEFLLAAIADTEGTIRATDTKASIALVLHGLLLTTLVGVTKELGQAVGEDCALLRVFIVLAFILGLSALASIIQLLRCIAPAPARAIPVGPDGATGSFFVPVGVRSGPRGVLKTLEAEEILERLERKSADDLCAELASELIKISAIRQRKLHLLRWGLGVLAVELGTAAAYVGGIGLLTV